MRNKKKGLLVALSALLLVALTVMGTLAYLTSEDTVTNTFTVGNVEIKLDEAEVNLDGTEIAEADRVKTNEYHLLPGHAYKKDPTVTVLKGSEDTYVRMLVTMNKQKEIHGISALKDKLLEIFTGFDTGKWIYTGNKVDDEHSERVYEFRYKGVVEKDSDKDTGLEPLFTGLKLPAAVNNEDLKKLEGFEIKVVAQAIQADGFGNAEEAWMAFE